MIPSNTSVRRAVAEDGQRMVEIMEANHHYYTPEVDGVAALTNQLTMSNNVMLVAEVDRIIVGFVIGTWDGARAFLFKLSVHPDFQGSGIGSELVRESARKFKNMGAVTLGLAAADGSMGVANNSVQFWEKLGFEQIPARLMIHFEIDELAGD